MGIPQELLDLKLWTPCYGSSKRPIIAPTHYDKALTYEEATTNLKQGQLFGLLVSPNNTYVIVDIDQEEIPTHIQAFLDHYPTYVEYSPSGVKAHIFYKVEKTTLKKAQLKDTNQFIGEIFIRDQFVTVTGNEHPLSSKDNTIAEVSINEFSRAFISAKSKDTNVIDITTKSPVSPSQLMAASANYTMVHVEYWLSVIPSTPTPRIIRAYEEMGLQTNSYDHWTVVAFALRDAVERLDNYYAGVQLFDKWSAKDPEKYQGPDETCAKFAACPPDPANGITVKTLQKLFRCCHIIWPDPKINKEGGPTPYPIEASFRNYLELFNFYNLKIEQNIITKAVRISGDEEIIQKYFSTVSKPAGVAVSQEMSVDQIESLVFAFAQDFGFNKASLQLVRSMVKTWADKHIKQVNPLKEWIESKPWDGRSRLPDLLNTLEFAQDDDPKAIALYKQLIKKNIIGVIRNNFYPGEYGGTSGIVIFQGLENTRKSTWVRGLLPHHLSQLYVGESQIFIQGPSSVKELQLEAGLFQIVLYDEVERLLQGKNASVLKNLLTQDYDTYRPLYGRTPEKVKRRAIFFGTTNEVKLQMANTGNRRIAIIPISYCDTEVQRTIDMQQVYAELLTEYNKAKVKESLWQLSPDEVVQVNSLNDEHKSESSLDTVIKDMFNFEHKFNLDEYMSVRGFKRDNNDRALNTVALTRMINIEHDLHVSQAQVTQVLHRLLGQWTKTSLKKLTVPHRGGVPGYVLNGQYVQSTTQKRWLLPPRSQQ